MTTASLHTPRGGRLALWLGLTAVAAACIPYFVDLGRAPALVSSDEANFSVHAASIAATGYDLNGHFLPLFVRVTELMVPNHSSDMWYQPLLFYLMAGLLKVLPFTESTIRLATVAVGVANVLLVYAIAGRLFSNRWYAAMTAVLLALTPSHFIMSRQAHDYICPLPFVLAWLWCWLVYVDSRRPLAIGIAGLALGLGLFSYIASWLSMPFFLLLSIHLLWWISPRAPFSHNGALVAGFLAPLVAAIPWLVVHPEPLLQTFSRYGLSKSVSISIASDIEPAYDLARRAQLYWDFYNPSFLFFAGGAEPTQATGLAGVFFWTLAPFLIVGLYVVARRTPSVVAIPLLAGFVFAPMPIIISMPTGPDYSIARAMLIVPFGVLIVSFGLVHLLERAGQAGRLATIAALIAIPLQFARFDRIYLNDFQLVSSARQDTWNARDVATFVVARDRQAPVPAVYFGADVDTKGSKWRFQLWKAQRMALWGRSHEINVQTFDPAQIEPGTLIVLFATDAMIPRLLENGFTTAATVNRLSGDPITVILERRSVKS